VSVEGDRRKLAGRSMHGHGMQRGNHGDNTFTRKLSVLGNGPESMSPNPAQPISKYLCRGGIGRGRPQDTVH